ncbi:unnamed protein product (macronuclear) [Paramecium tetraurelia]|uniref:Uncharacterized protein n=1 Tax=Paramecium tetraurelia TaxID=5888 RepID=A0CJU3_PARTE|nr:uncharacterized protein GSPATT00000772001 [Paramecium tetraurelia]CAK71060.1 unnamed protein product [Paramecium tetraurelia]|eukprot:XP_001438457.1 hypothetical protein (macronuclear) [Paramecium tetraurelia strain d4-2]
MKFKHSINLRSLWDRIKGTIIIDFQGEPKEKLFDAVQKRLLSLDRNQSKRLNLKIKLQINLFRAFLHQFKLSNIQKNSNSIMLRYLKSIVPFILKRSIKIHMYSYHQLCLKQQKMRFLNKDYESQ